MSRPLFDADYSAIEARIVCWLAGQEDALEEYRQGIDRYKVMASYIFGVPYSEVNKFPQRFVGKEAILMCGFQGGGDKLRRSCEKKGYKTLPVGQEHTVTEAFRKKHPRIKSYWYDTEFAAQQAVLHKGTPFRVRNNRFGDYPVPIVYQCKEIGGMWFLLCKLPSGRELAYPRPQLVPSRFEGKSMIRFFGKIGMTVNWGNADTYGGKLVENNTQAVDADIMNGGMHNAENAGYEVLINVHDQVLTYSKEGQSSVELVGHLKRAPAWADGLPIEAEGGEVPFYKKD